MQAEDLGDARPEECRVVLERGEAPDVDGQQVDRGLAIDDPLGQGPTRAAGRRDPDRVEAGADEETPDGRRLAEDELVVRREALGAVVELPDTGVAQCRYAHEGTVHQDREVVPVLVEQLELEGIRDLIGRDPRPGIGLEATDDEAADLLLEVCVAIRIAQDREVRPHPVDLVRDDIEVLGGVERHRDADLRREVIGPLTCAVDDDLGLDVAPVRTNARDGAVVDQDLTDPDVLDDRGAAHPRPACQGLGQIGRVGRPVAGQPDTADQVVDRHQRVARERLFRHEQLALEVEGLGRRGRTAQLHHPVLGPGDRHTAALLVAGTQPGLLLQLGIQLGRVLDEPCAGLRRAQLADQSGGVPRGAAGELALLQKHHVGLPGLGQVIGHARPDDTPADDDDPCPGGEVAHGRS